MIDIDRDVFETNLDNLVDAGYLDKILNLEDQAYFKAKQGLSWSDAVNIDSEIKKQILLCLIENPKTFFVLYNTQAGKMKIAAQEIRSWASHSDKRVVAFLMVDNDKTLADQSSDGVRAIVDGVADIFLLSSNSGDKIEDIKNKIDSYAAFGGNMPVIVALNNGKQVDKIVKLMEHVKLRMQRGGQYAQLRYGIVFDEADRIYPPVREKFSKLLITDDSGLHRLGFVSATEGVLMDEEYPECANAHMYTTPVCSSYYRAIHHDEAVVKHNVHRVKDGNDAYAETIIENNKDYFKNQIELKDGTMGFRKVIVNGGAKRASMESFATRRIMEGAYAITVNMNGVVVYRSGYEKKKYSVKGVRFGELLFKIYKELALHDKPLYIIGRRKVDRGLGFHFAPPDGSNGLVWTDMILGRVEDKNTAVQKAGRLAGIVAQCPQYPGKLTWWTDEKTASMVCRHNDIVDVANTKLGCSALQAITRAEVEVAINEDKPDHSTVPIVIPISPSEYESIKRKVKSTEWDYSTIYPIIERYKPDISSDLERIEKSGGKDQIVQPDVSSSTYSAYITDFVNASNNNKKHKREGNIKDKTKDTFQIYLDKIDHRIIVSIYYGSKTNVHK